jgi:hypothetical protein
MADINLLQNIGNQKKQVEGGEVPSYLGTIGVIILVVVILATGGLYLLASNAKVKADSLAAQQLAVQQKVTSLPDYGKFLAEQNSLTALSSLLQNHPDWSQVPVQFSNVTVKDVSYSSISINKDGTVTIQGTAPSFYEVDKYVMALNNKTISPFVTAVVLKNVSIGSQPNGAASSGAQSSSSGVTFTIVAAFNKSIWPTTSSGSSAASDTATQNQQ